MVTLDVEAQEIPVLMSHLIQESGVLDHPNVTQINPIPDLERDKELDMELSVQPGQFIETDPNNMQNQDHLLQPLASRAAMLDNRDLVRIKMGQ